VDLCRQNEGWLKNSLQKSGRPESASRAGARPERAN